MTESEIQCDHKLKYFIQMISDVGNIFNVIWGLRWHWAYAYKTQEQA